MDITEILLTAAIIFMAGIAQGAVGFGAALFATPPLLLIGMPLPNAITLIATFSTVQSVIGARHLRAAVPWKLAGTAGAIRVITLLIGMFVLKRMLTMDPGHIQAVIGGILCVLVVLQLLGKREPVDRMHWIWGALAFTSSGILAGISGMGGPPLVLWATAHHWPTERTRGFLFAVFPIAIPAQLVLLYLTFGTTILKSAGLALALTPLVYFSTRIGLPIGNRLGRARLVRIAQGILLLVGVSALAPVVIDIIR